MKKLMNKYFAGLAIAIFILGTASSMVGQQYQGCVASGGESRYDFQFTPNGNVKVKPGEKITLKIFYEEGKFIDQRHERIFKIDHPDKWQDPNDATTFRAAAYNFEGSLRNVTIPASSLSAIIEDGSNYRAVSASEKYVFPVDNPTDGAVIDGKKIRLLRLTGDRELEFDTAGMAEGFYWVTLQGIVTFAGQTSETCAKTTPPVLIQIKDDPVNRPPTVEITTVEGEACAQRTITAATESQDNQPDSRRTPRNLTLTWLINGQKVAEKSLGAVASYTDTITTQGLTPGEYTVEVRVKDDLFSVFDRRTFKLGCSGAGIMYFQYDEPYDGRVKFDIENYRDPDKWGIYRSRAGQCKSGKTLPFEEFPGFYERYATRPASVETNKAKLDSIGRFLRDNPTVDLYLLGYADFKNSKEYNRRLVDRRLIAVIEYLVENYQMPKTRFEQDRVINKSNNTASSYDKDPCSDGRMQDRRVELIYFTGTKPALPSYSALLE